MRSAFVLIVIMLAASAHAAEDGGHHYPYNVIALIVGHAEERLADGHSESGRLLGVEYERRMSEHWAWSVVFEQEAFGDRTNRHGVLAVPFGYFPTYNWRLFAAPGIEFKKDRGGPDQAIVRLGTSYSFHLGERFSISPEAQIDLLGGGDHVYVFAFAFGYRF